MHKKVNTVSYKADDRVGMWLLEIVKASSVNKALDLQP